MLTGFDYLERAFTDLFGLWEPDGFDKGLNSFSPGFAHPPDIECLYRYGGWLPRLLNRAFDTLPPFFTEDFNIVCPWNGTAVFWCAACVHACWPHSCLSGALIVFSAIRFSSQSFGTDAPSSRKVCAVFVSGRTLGTAVSDLFCSVQDAGTEPSVLLLDFSFRLSKFKPVFGPFIIQPDRTRSATTH